MRLRPTPKEIAMQAVDWLLANADTIVMLCGAFYLCVSCVVALTPSTKDDDALRRFMEYASMLRPKNVPGVFSIPGFREWAKDEADDA
jgi:hypothetical protein